MSPCATAVGVRLVVDENLSPRLCRHLTHAGDVTEHLRDALGAGASERAILDFAVEQEAVIVTADTDFGSLVTRSGSSRPSMVLVRDLLGCRWRIKVVCSLQTLSSYDPLAPLVRSSSSPKMTSAFALCRSDDGNTSA